MHWGGTSVSARMLSEWCSPVAADWVDVDLVGLRASQDTIVRRGISETLVSSIRPQWGYMAVLDVPSDGSVDEMRVQMEVLAGSVAVAVITRDDSVALYQQSVPTGWGGSLFLSFGLVDGATQLVLRSASHDDRPAIVAVHALSLRPAS